MNEISDMTASRVAKELAALVCDTGHPAETGGADYWANSLEDGTLEVCVTASDGARRFRVTLEEIPAAGPPSAQETSAQEICGRAARAFRAAGISTPHSGVRRDVTIYVHDETVRLTLSDRLVSARDGYGRVVKSRQERATIVTQGIRTALQGIGMTMIHPSGTWSPYGEQYTCEALLLKGHGVVIVPTEAEKDR